MSYCNGLSGLVIPEPIDLFEHIDQAALNASEQVKEGGKQIKMIRKQYNITEVSYAGTIWFNSSGRLVYLHTKKIELFKFKVVYEDNSNKEFVWCFN